MLTRRLIGGLDPGADDAAVPGEILEMARACAAAGVDELALLAPTADPERWVDLVAAVAGALDLPVVAGLDPHPIPLVDRLVAGGATRVVLQAAALKDPDVIAELAREHGRQAISVALHARAEGEGWRVLTGPVGAATEWTAFDWARVVEAQGAGELIVGSAAGPGEGGAVGQGAYDLRALARLSSAVGIAVIARGPPRGPEDLFDVMMIGDADGVLIPGALAREAAFIERTKTYLADRGIEVRPGAAHVEGLEERDGQRES